MDILIPDNAEFSEGDGTYWFQVAGGVQNGSYYSEKAAYEQLCSGKFYREELLENCAIEVAGVFLTYLEDTKGFYWSIYAFTVETGDDDAVRIMVEAG